MSLKPPDMEADLSTDLRLQNALGRRDLAFDNCRLVSYENFQLWTPYPWLQWTTSAKPPYPYVRPTPLSPHAHPPAIASTNTTNPQPPLPPSQLPRPIHDATVRRTAKRLPELRSRGCCGQGQTVGVPHGFHVRA